MRWLHVARHGLQTLFADGPSMPRSTPTSPFTSSRPRPSTNAAGLSPDDARRAAVKAFGDPVAVRDDVRDVSMWIWWERLAHDLRYSLRGFRRTPVFALAAVVSIALGIGAKTAIFSLFNALVLSRSPCRIPGRCTRCSTAAMPVRSRARHTRLYTHLKGRSDLVSGILQVDPWYHAARRGRRPG